MKRNKQKIATELLSSTLVQILKRAREDKELTQTALAEKLGLNQSSIAKIESGQVDLPTSRFVEMARVLGLEVVLIPKEKAGAIQALLKSTPRPRQPSFKDLLGVDEIEER
jgi:transcriptional regulator with XRE-family HTH domain